MYFLKNALRNILLIATCFFSYENAKAEKAFPDMDDIQLAIDLLDCNISGQASFLLGQFNYTCVKPPSWSHLFPSIVSRMVSGATGGLVESPFIAGQKRMKMHYDNLNTLDGNCSFSDRADPVNPKIRFAFCSNALLAFYAKPLIIGDVVANLISGKSLESAIDKALDGVARDFYSCDPNGGAVPISLNNSSCRMSAGDSGLFSDFNVLPKKSLVIIPWYVRKIADTIAVYTLDEPLKPLGAKFIKEPFPVSRYDEEALSKDFGCPTVGSCFLRVSQHSMQTNSYSALLIECTREMLMRLLVSQSLCNPLEGNSTNISESNYFHNFQIYMHRTVMALLTIYIMFIGFSIILGKSELKSAEMIIFLIKFVLVAYFSVGINISGVKFDGITSWLFPIMMKGANELGGIIMNSAMNVSGMCSFNTEDYGPDYAHIALWDSLDCKTLNYLGISTIAAKMSGSASFHNADALFSPIPLYLILLGPAIKMGNYTLISLLLTYPLMIIAIAAYTIQSTVVCMIMIVVLAYFAPIFVPMALFDYTKNYFESWFKLMFSFVLQPVVTISFICIMYGVFDQFYNTNCLYNQNMVDGKKSFWINQNQSSYSENDWKKCSGSIGYWLTPAGMVGNLTSLDTYKNAFPMLKIIKKKIGLFNDSYVMDESKQTLEMQSSSSGMVEDLLTMLWEFMMKLIMAIVILYVMYELSDQLSGIAADLTEGVSVGSLVPSIKSNFQSMNSVKNSILNAAKGGGGGAKDKVMNKGKGESDKITDKGDDKAKDKINSKP